MSTPISFRRACSIAFAPLVLVACSDTVSPAPALDVAVRVSEQLGPFPTTNPSSAQGLLCDVTFEAQGLGRLAHADWLDASVLFYSAPNRSVPFDSVIVSASDVRGTFSADTIGAGQVEHTRWLFDVAATFDIAMNFRYQVVPGGDVKTATAYFTCGDETTPTVSSRRPAISPVNASLRRVGVNGS
jgi:hypothetical protein